MKQSVIAIVGSVRKDIVDSDELQAAARDASRALGRELAKAGFRIVVYSSSPEFIEADVVHGFAEVATDRHHAILVRYPHRFESDVHFQEEAGQPDLFDRKADPDEYWETSFYQSLANLDGVMLVGGGYSTRVTGLIALSLGLPLLAVAAFKGAAEDIWGQLCHNLIYKGSEDTQAMVEWNDQSAAICVAGLKRRCTERMNKKDMENEEKVTLLQKAKQLDEMLTKTKDKRAKSIVALITTALFILVLLSGLVLNVSANTYTAIFLLGLVLAGSCGATVRVLWQDAPQTPILATIVLGTIAGILVGLAYVIPQWIGAPSFLDTQSSIDAKSKIQFTSSLIVAISAGVGFDIVFERFKKAAVEKAEKALKDAF